MKADKKQLTDFFKKLSDMNCITPVWEKVLDVLIELEPKVSFETLAVFCIYFSLLDDGNICIPVAQGKLIDKWQKKWEGLLLQENLLAQQADDDKYFADIINRRYGGQMELYRYVCAKLFNIPVEKITGEFYLI